MVNNLRLNKTIWVITGCLSLIAAVFGLFNNYIYTGLMPQNFIPAQFSQDILTIIVSFSLFYLAYKTTEKSYKEPIIILGILGSLSYLYAIFSIERIYNVMYFVYLAIMASSFYGCIFIISSFRSDALKKVIVAKSTRISTAILSIIIGILFSFLWISALLPLIMTGNKIENLYSIYVLDLVFVMPAFIITAVQTFLKKKIGYVLTPAMDILGIFVIFPLGLGEIAKLYFNMIPDYKSMIMSFVLSGIFLCGSVWQLINMKMENQ